MSGVNNNHKNHRTYWSKERVALSYPSIKTMLTDLWIQFPGDFVSHERYNSRISLFVNNCHYCRSNGVYGFDFLKMVLDVNFSAKNDFIVKRRILISRRV